jgi:tetratricopeptide (TPR) repeat protein
MWLEQYEPVGWAEELIEPAQTQKHRRLAQLYVVAAQCFATGRVDEALRYAEAGLLAIDSGQFDEVPYQFEASLSGPYITKGDPEKWVALCRRMIARWPEAHTYALARLVIALTVAGHGDEAIEASEGLIAEHTDNPHVASLALLAYGTARRYADPVAAYDAFRQGLNIARDSGNRQMESNLAVSLSRFAAIDGNHLEVFDNLAPTIRNHHDSGSFSLLPQPLAVLTIALDRLKRYEPAATISRFATTAFTSAAFPEIGSAIDHLRDVLGDEAYQSLASAGASMTSAAMTAYALEQIDRARTDLMHDEDAP